MKKRKIKIQLWIIFIVFFILTFLVVSKSYGLFEKNAQGDSDFPIGKWVIKLNNKDISVGQSQSFTVTTFTYTPSTTIEDGYIAPGRSGYFDVYLDATLSEVAVRYDITIDTQVSYADNIIFSVTPGVGGTAIQTGPQTYSGVVTLEDIEDDKIIDFRINVDWQDDINYDDLDSELGTIVGAGIVIPVTVHVIQYLGETITPYVAP